MDADPDFTSPPVKEEKKKSSWSSKARLYLLYAFLALVAIVVLLEGIRALIAGEAFNMDVFQKVLDGIIAVLST